MNMPKEPADPKRPEETKSLVGVSDSALSRLRDAIASGRISAPIRDKVSLAELGLREHAEKLHHVLAGMSVPACITLLDVVLEERKKMAQPGPELVWTGPEALSATARDTAVVVKQLFEGASESIILAGYSFDSGAELLEPLHRAIKERGVEALLFVHIKQAEDGSLEPEAYADSRLRDFMKYNWPFGAPYPAIYYDRRATRPGGSGAIYASLHAKCVIADGKRAFISSANFTNRGHERNIEAGVLLHDPVFAEHFARQWLGLISDGHVIRWQPRDV